jgi:predicted nucleic acid-binding Zn finger protein
MEVETNIWVRCGDQDDYHKFKTIGDAADYLAMMGCTGKLSWYNANGVSSTQYKGHHNYISLYWGGALEDQIDKGFSKEELATLNRELSRAVKERND